MESQTLAAGMGGITGLMTAAETVLKAADADPPLPTGPLGPAIEVLRAAMAPLAGRMPVPFPFDDPQTVRTALRRAREELEHVGQGILALEELYGQDPPPGAFGPFKKPRKGPDQEYRRAAPVPEAEEAEPPSPSVARGKAWRNR